MVLLVTLYTLTGLNFLTGITKNLDFSLNFKIGNLLNKAKIAIVILITTSLRINKIVYSIRFMYVAQFQKQVTYKLQTLLVHFNQFIFNI